MASLIQVFQPLVALLNSTVETTTFQNAAASTIANVTLNATASATPLPMPSDFSSLITLIYSFSALRDYLKLIVLGGAFETLRRLYSASYTNLVDRFFITATFESEDFAFRKPSYHDLALG